MVKHLVYNNQYKPFVGRGSKTSSSGSIEPSDDSLPSSSYHPIQIVTAHMDHKFELNLEALQELLLDEHVRDKPVVVLSVAGAFRKGKSFLLDFLLRFLENTVCC